MANAAKSLRWHLLILPILMGGIFLATTDGYGIFRDELYYLACGEHLGLGYVDHPPLVGWLSAAIRTTFGTSLFALRAPVAVLFALSIWLGARLTQCLGGDRMACVLTQVAIALTPTYLALFSLWSMNALDVVLWAGASLAIVKALQGQQRWWIWGGLAIGIGILNKVDPLFLALGLAIGLVLARRWDLWRQHSLWGGIAAAVAGGVPYLVWQAQHQWPMLRFIAQSRGGKIVALDPLEYVLAQFGQAGPLGWLLALVGLVALLAGIPTIKYRPLGWALLLVFILYATGGAKPYYYAVAFIPLYAAGAVALQHKFATSWPSIALGLTALFVMMQVGIVPLAKPILPVPTYLAYADALGVAPSSDENQELGVLPQHFADMHGWPELAQTVASVFHRLSPAERAVACIYTTNYGRAGAIDLFGRPLGLPPAISTHQSYWIWGPRGCTGELIILVGDERADHVDDFASLELAEVHRCELCMPYESQTSIWLGRGYRHDLAKVWSQAGSFQ